MEKPKAGGPAERALAAYRQVLAGKSGGGERPLAAREAAAPAGKPAPMKRAALPDNALLKTGGPAPAAPPPDKASKYRRTAEFLVLIGGEEAAGILSRLDPEQVEAVSKEIVSLDGISPEEGAAVLKEFRALLARPFGYSGSVSGGVEAARRLLYAAFGPDKGEGILKRAAPETAGDAFGFLRDFSGEQIAFLFRDESPAAEALVLSRLPSALAAAALAHTGQGRRLEVVRRIAKMGETSPEVLEQVAAALREKARHIGTTETPPPDGIGALTEILKHSDISFGDRLLEELAGEDPALGRSVQERLFTLEDVTAADDRQVQEKLRNMSDRDIALLLKGRSETFTQKILTNLSKGREEMVREETEIMGPVPKIEAEAAGREFLAWFRQRSGLGK
ncbi:MAG: flagellar motor switch protein FliG [Treponematales bacterium]